jgi:hypothetical protein
MAVFAAMRQLGPIGFAGTFVGKFGDHVPAMAPGGVRKRLTLVLDRLAGGRNATGAHARELHFNGPPLPLRRFGACLPDGGRQSTFIFGQSGLKPRPCSHYTDLAVHPIDDEGRISNQTCREVGSVA